MTCMRARRSSKFGQIRQLIAELAALERLNNPHRLIMGKMVLTLTFSRLFLSRSISHLQVTMTYMRVWMSLKFGQIRLLVSMVTDRVIMEKTVLPLFSAVFSRSFSYLQVMISCMRAQRKSKFGQIRLLTAELTAL